ncbi:hypothetical protein KDK_32890 [Dictyobacter kobayashii]|uniref:Zinc-ribbon domain-containing protein n=2 Tax=Dictyobacter kobayashii TaxID=2014872 RepID=A0A402AKA4_9CHLR|nr:hypothetical protein KDK_32890 [Dictyobacter kobayashii]
MCTGLGVLVRSQLKAGNSNLYENWVLTDGTLVNNEKKATCLSSAPAATLSQISIYTSSLYNSQQLIKFDAKANAISVRCPAGSKPCTDGPVLFSFTSGIQEPQPFIDLSTSQGTSTNGAAQNHALILAKSDASLDGLQTSTVGSDQPNNYANQLASYRTPITRSLDNKELEAGTPLVNAAGELVGMRVSHASTLLSLDTLRPFLDATLPKVSSTSVVSPVYDNWKKGMDAYYQQMLDKAQPDFRNAYAANSNFQAAQQFASAGAQNSREVSRLIAPTPAPASGLSFLGLRFPYWQVAVLVGILLVLVALVLFMFWRARTKQRKRLDAELADAEQRATIEAQRIRLAEMEAAQGKGSASQSGSLAAQPAILKTGPLGTPALHCPRCGDLVAPEDNFCTNCQQQLLPADLAALSPEKPAFSGSPNGAHASVVPASPSSSSRSIAEQPTIVPAGAIAEQPTIVPGRSISEQPTIDIPAGSESTAPLDPEKTVPYAMRQLSGRRLGIVVGARSDPGIKRKYKPNEDSLFAAQGLVNSAQKPPMFGLFVVADGMGDMPMVKMPVAQLFKRL